VRAANTSPAEARRRMRAMRKRVREHDVARWAASFLDTLSGAPGSDQPAWEPEAS
jgi:trehalose-6-phosphate synthase